MRVEVGELVSNVHVMDGDSILTPQMIRKVTQLILKVIEEREHHQERVHAEQRVSEGVSHELQEDFD